MGVGVCPGEFCLWVAEKKPPHIPGVSGPVRSGCANFGPVRSGLLRGHALTLFIFGLIPFGQVLAAKD